MTKMNSFKDSHRRYSGDSDSKDSDPICHPIRILPSGLNLLSSTHPAPSGTARHGFFGLGESFKTIGDFLEASSRAARAMDGTYPYIHGFRHEWLRRGCGRLADRFACGRVAHGFQIFQMACAWPVSPSAVERNTAAVSLSLRRRPLSENKDNGDCLAFARTHPSDSVLSCCL